MSWLWLMICVLLFLAGLSILIWQRTRYAHQLAAMRRLRESELYAAFYPVLQSAMEKGIDEVRIEKERITFMGIIPPGKSAEFVFTAEGFRCPDRGRLEAMTQLIALDAEDLQSEKYFALSTYRVIRPNGDVERAYVYSARQGYRQAFKRRAAASETEIVY